MPRVRRRLHYCWPQWAGLHHPYTPFGPPPGWAPPWWGVRPTLEEEKEAVTEHIAALKEALAEAEEYLKELEEEK